MGAFCCAKDKVGLRRKVLRGQQYGLWSQRSAAETAEARSCSVFGEPQIRMVRTGAGSGPPSAWSVWSDTGQLTLSELVGTRSAGGQNFLVDRASDHDSEVVTSDFMRRLLFSQDGNYCLTRRLNDRQPFMFSPASE